MWRPDWRLSIAGVASVVAAIVLAVPQGRLAGTTDQRQEALTPAPDFDVCDLLDELLGESSGGRPNLTREDDVAVERTLEIRHPHRSRRGCTLDGNDLAFGPSRLRFKRVELIVTTVSDHQDALDRMHTSVSRAVAIGPGALIEVEEDRSSMSNFLIDDNDAWQSFQQYVVGSHHAALFFYFSASDQEIDPTEVVADIEELVDPRLDPDDFPVD